MLHVEYYLTSKSERQWEGLQLLVFVFTCLSVTKWNFIPSWRKMRASGNGVSMRLCQQWNQTPIAGCVFLRARFRIVSQSTIMLSVDHQPHASYHSQKLACIPTSIIAGRASGGTEWRDQDLLWRVSKGPGCILPSSISKPTMVIDNRTEALLAAQCSTQFQAAQVSVVQKPRAQCTRLGGAGRVIRWQPVMSVYMDWILVHSGCTIGLKWSTNGPHVNPVAVIYGLARPNILIQFNVNPLANPFVGVGFRKKNSMVGSWTWHLVHKAYVSHTESGMWHCKPLDHEGFTSNLCYCY